MTDWRRAAWLMGTIASAAFVAPAAAQVKTFDIPAGPAPTSITALGRQADIQIVAARRATAGKRTNAVRGDMNVEQALAALLSGTGLSARKTGSQTYTVVTSAANPRADTGEAQTASTGAEGEGAEILVTGTHIAGAPVASPVLQVTQRQMREANQRDLGEVIRSIPMNYTGGQNPGSRFQTGAPSNSNGTGSSGLNLRGLGPDATLTLLNGHRLAYDGTSQAVDVSGIPLDAVASIQIVPDGASAVYGSDAVAGVANILLKRDFSGLTTSARLGGATDGGGFQYAFDAVAGTTWQSGGVLVAGQYDHQNPVRSNQRDYTRYVIEPNYLLDKAEHFGGLITAHQDLSESVTLSIDAVFSHRETYNIEYSDLDYAAPGTFVNENYAISPTLAVALPGGWQAELNGVYAGNFTDITSNTIEKSSNTLISVLGVNYRNRAYSGELTLAGPLFKLPGGDAQLAMGGGYRQNRLWISQGASQRKASNSTYYGYGEVSLPFVSSVNAMPLLNSLIVSAALRHEEYRAFGGVTTPKLGLVYGPTPDIDLKLSWGRSFKAPTLRELSVPVGVSVQRASSFGGGAYPAGSLILVSTGGNRDLKPERARTVSATAEFHPRGLPGFRAALTYFDIQYSDRVVQPLQIAQRNYLTNPLVARYVQFAPSAADQAALIARDLDGLGNVTGIPYNPTRVVAIANGLLINAASQDVRGMDLSGSYAIVVTGGNVTLSGSGSWLTSEQRNVPGAAAAQLAGAVYNPPKFRTRVGVTAHLGGLTIAGFANYSSPLLDKSVTPAIKGDDYASFDLNLLWKLPAGSVFAETELSLGVQNLTDAHSPYLTPIDETAVNYDSSNYSPLGRFISIGLRKRW